MPRMKILNTVEQEDFETPPMFNNIQRKRYFDFPSAILETAQSLRTPTNQVCHLVACGYFLAAKRFYSAQTFHQRDIDYVAKMLNLSSEQIDPRDYDRRTRFRHRNQILDFYGFRSFDQEAKTLITPEIEAMVCSQLRPKLILFRTVDILVREKVEIPGYYPNRLIKNAIICWNYLYLSQKIADTVDRESRDTIFKAITAGSVVSWQHINLLGEYDFSEEKLRDSVGIKPPKFSSGLAL